MKTRIEPADIRKGDLIRWEASDLDYANEWRAIEGGLRNRPAGAYFLLDRPKPTIELPTVPTLGWASWYEGEQILAVWELCGPARHESGDLRQTDSTGNRSGGNPANIRTFTPAVAVPKAAVERLRHQRETRNLTNADVDIFLAAVDEAQA